jgi:RiboL-PSP-HEPN
MMKSTKGKLKEGSDSVTSTTGISTPPPTVTSVTPYSIFQSSVKRAKNLIAIHGLAHGKQGQPPPFLSDAHRASIVLAVSALDAYVRTLVIDRIVSTVANPKKVVPEKLREHIKACLGHDIIFEAARQGDLSSKVEKAMRDKFDDQSFQGVKKITEAMRLIGYEDVFVIVAQSASENETILKEKLSRFTKRRHIIAHCGDYDLNQTPPEENKLLKEEVLECIRVVELVAREINKLS